MRKLATLSFSFAAAAFIAQYFLSTELLLFAAAFAVALGLLGLLFSGKVRERILWIAVGLSVSFAYNYAYAMLVRLPMEHCVGVTETMTMELLDYAEETEYGAKAEVKILGKDLWGHAVYYGETALLECEPGQQVTAQVLTASATQMDDEEIHTFYAKGIYLLLYNRGEEQIDAGRMGSIRYLPQRVGRLSREMICTLYPAESAGFMQAILLGEKALLSDDVSTTLSEAGLFHITAVSGLHCTFLLALLAFVIGKHHQRLLFAISVPTLLFYALLVGASPSVVRAVIMMIMLLTAPLFGRESDSITSLATALLLILLHNPHAVMSISLQLSFASIAGIMLIVPKFGHILEKDKVKSKKRMPRIFRMVLGSFAVTAGSVSFTAPLSAYYFNMLPIVSPLSNLLCLGAASIVFGIGFLSVLVGFIFMPFARLLAFVPQLGIEYITAIAAYITRLPHHAIYFNNQYLQLWLAYAYAVFILCHYAKRIRFRYAVATVLTVATLALSIYLNTFSIGKGSMDMIALDVGQGQSVLFTSQGKTVLVDCGSSNSWVNAGDVAADTMLSYGLRRLDSVVLTHYDADHTNGLETLFARVAIDMLYLPVTAEDGREREKELRFLAQRYGVPVSTVEKLDAFTLGDAAFMLYPPVGSGGTNEEGVSILCTTGDFDVLITGDMDMDTERLLIETFDFPDVELLMVGHHGSKHSTARELLADITPEVGIVSVGRNSYGHPTDEALMRLTDEGIAVYRTDLQGNVMVTVR